MRDDPTVLGQLLFGMLDLDRETLGGYLSWRTSKAMLKSESSTFSYSGPFFGSSPLSDSGPFSSSEKDNLSMTQTLIVGLIGTFYKLELAAGAVLTCFG